MCIRDRHWPALVCDVIGGVGFPQIPTKSVFVLMKHLSLRKSLFPELCLEPPQNVCRFDTFFDEKFEDGVLHSG